MKNKLWISAGVLLSLSFLLDLSTKWFDFVPNFFSQVLLWASAFIGLIVLGLLIWEEVVEKRKN